MIKVSKCFQISIYEGSKPYKPLSKHTYGMYLDGKWYGLTAKDGTYDSLDPVHRLDVSILQENLLMPILGINDPRTDNRNRFCRWHKGIEELEKTVMNGNRELPFQCIQLQLKI